MPGSVLGIKAEKKDDADADKDKDKDKETEEPKEAADAAGNEADELVVEAEQALVGDAKYVAFLAGWSSGG